MKHVILILTVLLVGSIAVAAPRDDTIEYYLSKSDVVLSATLTDFVVERGKDTTTYKLIFKTHTGGVYHGKGPHGEELKLNLVHPGDLPPGERTLKLDKGQDYILFLKKPGKEEAKVWRQADPWFAVQLYYSALAHKVREVSQAKRKQEDRKVAQPSAGGDGKPAPQP